MHTLYDTHTMRREIRTMHTQSLRSVINAFASLYEIDRGGIDLTWMHRYVAVCRAEFHRRQMS